MLCMLFPADDCRNRWKSWRDTHRRERRKEKESCRSGAEVSTSRPWRYSQIMAFLPSQRTGPPAAISLQVTVGGREMEE